LRTEDQVITYSSAVSIARPPAVVFPYLIEREKQALWSDVPMRPLTEGPFRVGSRMELTLAMGPLKTTVQLEYASVEPNSLVTWRTVSAGGIQWQGEYRLQADAAGTRLSQAGTLEFRGAWRLLEPIIGAEMRNGEVKELERLKGVVEAS
jgi:uncharacterized protein YndB with AHSA1/START domain